MMTNLVLRMSPQRGLLPVLPTSLHLRHHVVSIGATMTLHVSSLTLPMVDNVIATVILTSHIFSRPRGRRRRVTKNIVSLILSWRRQLPDSIQTPDLYIVIGHGRDFPCQTLQSVRYLQNLWYQDFPPTPITHHRFKVIKCRHDASPKWKSPNISLHSRATGEIKILEGAGDGWGGVLKN